jgi:hypothetical protein
VGTLAQVVSWLTLAAAFLSAIQQGRVGSELRNSGVDKRHFQAYLLLTARHPLELTPA